MSIPVPSGTSVSYLFEIQLHNTHNLRIPAFEQDPS